MIHALLLFLLWTPVDDVLRELYQSGRTYAMFLEEANRRKAMWERNTEAAAVRDPLLVRANAVGGQWYLLAVAVDGCSDSANTIPYLNALASEVEGLDMRIVDSDAGRTIMEANRTPDGRAATPTVVLLDAEFNQVGVFVERPAPLQEWSMENRDGMSSGDFLKAKFAWYDEDAGHTTMEEVVALMEAAGSN